jgi:DNA-binding protein HU-beta
MNKSELIDALSERFEGNRKQAAHALDAVLDTITRQVAKGEKVAITGFVSFAKTVRNARWVRNPQTGDRMKTGKKAVPKFTAGADLKNAVSGAKTLPAAKKAAAAAKSAPAKKSPTKKASPAKKGAAKNPAATKSTAGKKSTLAKKGTAKKTGAAKKSPARKGARHSTSAVPPGPGTLPPPPPKPPHTGS